MSSSPIGNFTIPDLGYYTSPSNLPAGLQTSTNSSSTSVSKPAQTPYQQAYQNLQIYDNQELLDVSFGTPQSALTNVLSVLSQWAAYQQNGYASAPSAPPIVNSLA